jgi:hypothetical protein
MHDQGNGDTSVSIGEPLIQGGTISGLDQEVNWRAEKHHAVTASRLAFLLVLVLVLSFVLHYSAIIVLSVYGRTETVEALSSLFGVWLPVMSGFVGGAVTYYFTREQNPR